MSKESVPSGPDADGPRDRAVDVDTGRDAAGTRNVAAGSDRDPVSPTELVFGMGSTPNSIGPRIDSEERDALEAVDVDPDAIEDKAYSYRMLLDAGVDEPLADDLRRRLSLPWSHESDGDLDRRSSEVRGLGEAEREWIAASEDEDWQSFEYAASRELDIDRPEPSERPWPEPTPVTAVTGVGPDDADRLADAGVRSAERLATVNAFAIANALEVDVLHVRMWRHNARELLE